jgi:glutamate racemase
LNAKDYIAVFDSGVGGISVLRELVRVMPGENYLYFGDSANAPYGTKTPEQVRQLTFAAAEQLLDRGIKALVIACNTATAAAIDDLREKYPDRIITGIEPAIKPAVKRFPTGHIGIMATPVTLKENKLARQLACFPDANLIPIPAPGLVELVESGQADSPETVVLLQALLKDHIGKLDALVLGCTHYPFAANAIRQVMGDIPLFDGGYGTARQTQKRLQEAGLLLNGEGSVQMENSLGCSQILKLSMELMNNG